MLLLMSRAVVGITTSYTLDGRGIESRWKAGIYAPIQSSPEVQPASCEWVPGLHPVGKPQGRGADHPSSSSTEVKGKVELHFWAFTACSTVHFTGCLLAVCSYVVGPTFFQ
jgi:hypothetical protein